LGRCYLVAMSESRLRRRGVPEPELRAPSRFRTAKALKLTRFRGHPNTCVQGAHDGEDKTTLQTGIPSIEFGHRCREAGVRPSMGSIGDAYDNAMCESFFATLECELLDRPRFKTQAEARIGVRVRRGFGPQPAPPSFVDRVSLPNRLQAPSRGQSRRTPACHRARVGQGQALRAAPNWGRP
jgi:hypothetical protein